MPPNELIQTVVLALVCFANKPPGPKHHRSDAGPGMSYQRQNNNSAGGDENLFHYSGNLNKNKESNVGNPIQRHESAAVIGSRNPTRSLNDVPTNNQTSDPRNGRNQKEKDVVVGKVAFGCCVKNPIGRFHWEKMVLQPRTVVNDWHYLK